MVVIYTTQHQIRTWKMCPCTCLHHALPHWKYVLRCCDKCTSIVIPSQEANIDTPTTYPTMWFCLNKRITLYIAWKTSIWIKKTCSMWINLPRANAAAKLKGAFQENFPGFSGLEFWGNSRVQNLKAEKKASEHNGCTVF